MVENKDELLHLTDEFMGNIMRDIRDHMQAFMEFHNVSSDELADAIGIQQTEINRILGGVNDMNLSTFAKILISTDNVIEVKPISETDFDSYQDMLGLTNDKENTEEEIVNTVNERIKQPRDSRGRFVKRQDTEVNETTSRVEPNHEQRIMGQTPPPINREEVLSVISHFGWDDMVDEVNDSDVDLLHFLYRMGVTPQDFDAALEEINNETEQFSDENEKVNENVTNEQCSNVAEMAAMIANVLTSNPNLVEQIKRLVNSK